MRVGLVGKLGVLIVISLALFSCSKDTEVQGICMGLQGLADQGDEHGMLGLGDCYRSGKGIDQDLDNAIYWYEKAAEKSNSIAKHNLANIYLFELNDEARFDEAVRLLEEAAPEYPPSNFSLGVLHLNSIGVKAKPVDAVPFFVKASERNHEGAMFALFMMHCSDAWGVKVNEAHCSEYKTKLISLSQQAGRGADFKTIVTEYFSSEIFSRFVIRDKVSLEALLKI